MLVVHALTIAIGNKHPLTLNNSSYMYTSVLQTPVRHCNGSLTPRTPYM